MSNFSIKDLQQKEHDLRPVNQKELARVIWRIESLKEKIRHFNETETGFINQMYSIMLNGRAQHITKAQEKWIFRLWHGLYMDGKVELPPGKF